MKWLIVLKDHEYESTAVVSGAKEKAEKDAQKLFDQYRYDSCREFEEPDAMPSVIMYEVGNSFKIDMLEYYTKKLDEEDNRRKEYREREERDQYERLQKEIWQEMIDIEEEFQALMKEAIDKVNAKLAAGTYDTWEATDLICMIKNILDHGDTSRYGKMPKFLSELLLSIIRPKAVYEKFQITKSNIHRIVDGLGYPVDENIRDIVVSFNERHFDTSASCEGHNDHGLPYPWLDFSAYGRPIKHSLVGFYRNRVPLLFLQEYASCDRLRPIDGLSPEQGRREMRQFIEWLDAQKKLPVHLMIGHLHTQCGLTGDDALWGGYGTLSIQESTCEKCKNNNLPTP